MPTYQYACTECDHSFEQFQSFSDDALTVCPQCQGRLRKVFNAVGVVFKGSGFYRTDSRKDAVSSNGNGNGTSGSESGGKSDSTTTSSSTGDGSGSGKSSSTASTGAKPAGGTPAASSKSSAA